MSKVRITSWSYSARALECMVACDAIPMADGEWLFRKNWR